jgi:crotonobetainyl-CoA:carnitine CoA-transferase CaiB-like acyl-CoA transferase
MPQAALKELLALARVEGEAQIAGADPVLRTPYRVGTAGAAALAAVGIAAAELWRLRTGRGQKVSVDLRAAAASLRSGAYLRIDGKPPPPIWDPLSAFYPVRDGRWVRFHCNYPHHRKAAMTVLGVGEDRKAAEAASASWDGVGLEDAIHAAGGCAGFARTAQEWASHPQASAVARQPLLEIARIGDAPPQPLPKAERPLAGIRVLDLTRVLAGPTAAKTLAEHGADVLKITAAHLPDSGDIDLDTGLGKLSAHLDLRDAQGVQTLRRLAQGADVFSQSYRPGSLAARGFSPEQLAQLRPGIVYVSLSAWGQTGPWKDRRGFDSIVQCVSGMAYAQGGGEAPKLLPCSAIDYVSGYLMAFGAMVALARRAREGGSWRVRVALARVGKWIVDRGMVDPAGAVEPEAATMETLSPVGVIRHLRPVVEMSETPPRWERPPVPLGFNRAEWA